MQDFRTAVIQIQEIYQPYESGEKTWNSPPELEVFKLKHPPWHCQPYVRPPPEDHLKKLEEIKKRPPPTSSPAQELQGLSKRKMKKCSGGHLHCEISNKTSFEWTSGRGLRNRLSRGQRW